MQLLLHLPDDLVTRFKAEVPARRRSAYVRKLLEKALPLESDPLYQCAVLVEQDDQLHADMDVWDVAVADGLADYPWEGELKLDHPA